MRIILHGGAANIDDLELKEQKTLATQKALENVTKNPVSPLNTALDIAEAAVAALENEPALNAGTGSIIQLDGRIRMDAGICDSSGRYGAVIQIENVKNPVKISRKILDAGYHSILSGQGAIDFAREHGFASYSPYTQAKFEEYMQIRNNEIKSLKYSSLSADIDETNIRKLGTVGAVVIDDNGNMAAACSTGGTKYCYPGRVGDTSLFGAGLYCSEHIAVACTGEGDKILRRLTAKKVEEIYLANGDIQKATDEAINDLKDKEGGYGGLVAIAADGKHAKAFSTLDMAYAFFDSAT